MKKILIYTYNPFGRYKKNAAKELVRKLKHKNVRKIYLNTNYKLETLLNTIMAWKPDIVLGVGQNFDKRVCIERTFKNLIINNKERKKIGKKLSYRSKLPLRKMTSILGVKISDNAGKLNCNYSIYVLLSKGINAGFVHVPSVKYFKQKEFLPKFNKLIEFLSAG